MHGAIGLSFQGHVYSVFCSHLVRASQVKVLSGKNLPAKSRRLMFAPGLGRFLAESSNLLQFSCLKSHGQRILEYSLWGPTKVGLQLSDLATTSHLVIIVRKCC